MATLANTGSTSQSSATQAGGVEKHHLCPSCQILKPASAFPIAKVTKRSPCTNCREDQAEANRAFIDGRKANAEAKRQKIAAYWQERRADEEDIKRGVRKCGCCGQTKPIGDYRKSAQGLLGFSKECKQCMSERGKTARKEKYRSCHVFTCTRAILKRQEYGTNVCAIEEAHAYKAVAYMLDEFGMIRPEYARQYPHRLDDIRLGRTAARERKQAEADAKREAVAMARAQAAIEKAKDKADRQARRIASALTQDDIKLLLWERIRSHMKKQRRYRKGCCISLGKFGRTIDQAMLDTLGYTVDRLLFHIEAQFVKGMTWGKVASGAIHIDHVVPAADFDLLIEKEVRACYSLGNLRPAYAEDNIRKRDSRDFLV